MSSSVVDNEGCTACTKAGVKGGFEKVDCNFLNFLKYDFHACEHRCLDST